MVASASRITKKRMWVVAKLTAPREERIVRDSDKEREQGSGDPPPPPGLSDAGSRGQSPGCIALYRPEGFVLGLGLRAANLGTWALGCEAVLARRWG